LECLAELAIDKVIDNTAYIATSLRGKGSYLYDVRSNDPSDDMAGVHIKESHPLDNAVIDGLRRCQAFAVDTDRGHMNMGNCGKTRGLSAND
jgi:hypothetical protein